MIFYNVRGEVMKKLTERQKKFCDEYLIDYNATQAAIRAGYNKKTAYSQGQRLLKNVEVKAYIDEQIERLHNEKTADAREVMEYLTSVMRGESRAEIVVVEGKGDGCSKAVKIDKRPDEKEKLKAAELLGKRFGLFKEKVEVESDIPVVIKGGGELEK